jgi:hypothetical protein
VRRVGAPDRTKGKGSDTHMSLRLKTLAAFNVLGWLVVVPLVLASALGSIVGFSDWSDRLLPGGADGTVWLAGTPEPRAEPTPAPAERAPVTDDAVATGDVTPVAVSPAPAPAVVAQASARLERRRAVASRRAAVRRRLAAQRRAAAREAERSRPAVPAAAAAAPVTAAAPVKVRSHPTPSKPAHPVKRSAPVKPSPAAKAHKVRPPKAKGPKAKPAKPQAPGARGKGHR